MKKEQKYQFVENSFRYNKEWYKSKTIWASLATFVVSVLSAIFGETNVVVSGIISLFSLFGIYGRTVADTSIKK